MLSSSSSRRLVGNSLLRTAALTECTSPIYGMNYCTVMQSCWKISLEHIGCIYHSARDNFKRMIFISIDVYWEVLSHTNIEKTEKKPTYIFRKLQISADTFFSVRCLEPLYEVLGWAQPLVILQSKAYCTRLIYENVGYEIYCNVLT